MKKNLVALLIIGAVACANAAKVDWGVCDASEGQRGYICFLVSALDSSWKSVGDISSAAQKLGSGTSGTITKDRGTVYSMSETANGDGVTVDSMSHAYIVVVSGEKATSYNYYGGDFSKSVYDGLDPAGETVAITWEDVSANTGTFSQTDPTPEPTSGLLLLLGAAGLALRRRVK